MANFLKSLFIKGIEVDTTGASTGNVLSYNGTKFAPAAPGSGSLALNDLSDVTVASPEEGQTLYYDGSGWLNEYPTTVSNVNNAESTTLTIGTAVYLYGGTGNHASVKRADNNSDSTSSKTVGLVSKAISAGANGPVVTRGYVDGINLSTGYTAGDVLWLGENGAFTTTKPTAPDHLVFIGVVVRATSNGIIYVATQNGYELDELHNVSLPSPQSGEFLKYDGSLWVADAIDLGTDTVGSYVATITAGTGLSSTGASTGEGIAHSLSLASAYGDTTNPYGSKTANYFLASPNGSSGVPTFRAIVAADIPTLNQNTTGTAAKWTTARTITLGGDLTGSVSIDGSADATLTATVAANSVALGTDTTGNYMADVSAGTGVSVSHTPGEGSSATVSLSSNYGDTQNPYASKTANFFLASPNGSAGAPVFRAIVAADIPTLNQNTTGTAADITASSNTSLTSLANLATVGTITSGTWSGSFGAVSGANLTTLNGTNISSGTVAAARLPSVWIGTTAVPLSRSSSNLTLAGITLTSPSESSPTITGTATYSLGSLSSTSGTVLTGWQVSGATTNTDVVDFRLIRRAAGSDWTTAYHRIQRLVDVTRQGFIQFGGNTGTNSGVEIGYGETTYLSVNGTTGIVNIDLPITSTQSFSATNSGNQTNYVKLGTGATDSNATLFGFTAYGNLRTTCGYNVGISWISTGGASPSGFVPNAHAVFLAGTTVSGDIRSNTTTSTSYNTTSDYRLKKDVVDIKNGIELIRQLKPKRFKFIDDQAETVFDGFLAHEVQDIVPVAVSGTKDAIGENGHPMYQQIDTSWMVALLTAGIKELDARLAVLESN